MGWLKVYLPPPPHHTIMIIQQIPHLNIKNKTLIWNFAGYVCVVVRMTDLHFSKLKNVKKLS